MRHVSPFALFAGLAAFALAAFAPAILNDGDTYWHIRAGEWMLAHHAVLRADVFSYTVAGIAWHTQEWLAEVLMALAWQGGGWAAIHLLFAVAAAATAGVVAGFVEKRAAFVPALVLVVLGLGCITGSLLARPHTLSLPLLAIWTAGLAAAREQNRAPHWALVVVMPLWANLHGSFAFGLALAGALAMEAVLENEQRGRALRDWGLFLLAATLSAMLTPFGFHALLFPIQLSGMSALGHIGEWQPSDFARLSPFAVALLAAFFFFGRGIVRVPTLRLLMTVGIVWLALSHARHQMLFGVTMPILLAPSLGAAWPAAGDTRFRTIFASIAAFLLVAMVTLRLSIPVARPENPATPAAALAHVPLELRAGPVLNEYAFGGYLIWQGVKPFIDSRADLYGDRFVSDYARIIAPDPEALKAALNKNRVRWTMFAANSPVALQMDSLPGWHRIYGDGIAVVHARAAR
ncbi:MAG: hypothetical protein ISS15_06235 [Alphaproteobacteria bacterium]|nr:hypothetical protein [Alphaproteobacteria bacterium]MBL7097239.1 hypothetical protein [Alphaproteobacteria bacterium]